MKNIVKILCVILCIFCVPQLTAQEIIYGVVGGGNLPSLSDEAFKEFRIGDSGLTYHVGGVLEYEISNTITLRPKVLLSRQGDFEESDFAPDRTSSRDLDYKLSYINIPLQVKIFSQPYVLIGPQVGLLIATTKGDNDFGDLDTSFDYGLTLGAGYDFNQFFVEINVYQGLQTLITLPDGSLPVGRTDELTNTVFSLSLGYFFKERKKRR